MLLSLCSPAFAAAIIGDERPEIPEGEEVVVRPAVPEVDMAVLYGDKTLVFKNTDTVVSGHAGITETYTSLDLLVDGNRPWTSKRNNIEKIEILDKWTPTNCEKLFYNLNKVTEIVGLENMDTSNVTTMKGMFESMKAITSLNVTYFDTSNVTTMDSMFRDVVLLEELDVSNFDTSNVASLKHMFSGLNKITELDISNFVTQEGTDITSIFKNMTALEKLSLGEGFIFNSKSTIELPNAMYNEKTGEPLKYASKESERHYPAPQAATYLVGEAPTPSNYTVEYYKQNVNDDEYTLDNSETKSAETWSTVDVYDVIDEALFEHCHINKDINTGDEVYGHVYLDGSTTFKVYYDLDTVKTTFTDSEDSYEYTEKYGATNIQTPDVDERPGYTLSWAAGEDAVLDETYSVTEDTNFVSVWTPNTYEITFDDDIGGDYQPLEAVFDQPYGQLPVPEGVKEGYRFAGWVIDGTATKVTSETIYNTPNDVKLVARWLEPQEVEYTVNHYQQNADDNDYTLESTETLTGFVGDTATATAKEYNHFHTNNRHVSAALEAEITEDGAVLNVYYDRDLVSVKLTSDDEVILDTDVKYGSILVYDEPKKSDYTLDGWYMGDVEVDLTQPIMADIDVVAKWTKKTVYYSSSSSSNRTPSFSDVKRNDWFYNDVVKAVNSNYMEAISGKFMPNDDATRAVTAYALAKIKKAASSQLKYTEGVYEDVLKNTKYSSQIIWCTNNDIMIGYGDGTFGPNDSLTREQFALVLYRVYAKQNDSSYNWSAKYADQAEKVSEWARDAMCWAVAEGLLEGNENGDLMPQKAISRAEVCAVLNRIYKTQIVATRRLKQQKIYKFFNNFC